MWRKGMTALTSESAYDMKLPDGYVGNLLSFVNPEADPNVLSWAFPVLLSYFASFVFKTRAQAKAFKDLVKPSLKSGDEILVCSLIDCAPAQMDDTVRF